ncbi:hypothetical protein D5086_028561 [Populus alba]|uniref:Uncharacterized protein n=1 Tax=Populus alba TaxID=43335 RepID=A0ACC4AZE8_POPAL
MVQIIKLILLLLIFFLAANCRKHHLLFGLPCSFILTFKLLLLFNVFGFGLICALSLLLTEGTKRVHVLGWICMVFALCVFVAPLGVVRKVIKTKSVEFMPFSLSFFLTLSAVMWFFYGYLKKDKFVAIPNILGFIFGILQMVLYLIYRNPKKNEVAEPKTQELSEQYCSDINIAMPKLNEEGGNEVFEAHSAKDQTKEAMDVTNKV